jgi:hypothetical protein
VVIGYDDFKEELIMTEKIMHPFKVNINGYTFINICPHAVDILFKDGKVHHFDKPTEDVPIPRVEEIKEEGPFSVESFPAECPNSKMGNPVNVPLHKRGTVYITSSKVAETLNNAGRDDFIAPGTLIRDENGQPVGANGFKFPM